jgi:CBS domain-containing protein
MRASEVMVPNPFVAVANASASEVAIMFRSRNISVVPVVDDHRTRRFLGVLSDRDLVTRCLAAGTIPCIPGPMR